MNLGTALIITGIIGIAANLRRRYINHCNHKRLEAQIASLAEMRGNYGSTV